MNSKIIHQFQSFSNASCLHFVQHFTRFQDYEVLYRVPDIQSEVAEDRKAGDMAFFHEVCEEGLGITLKSEDIKQMYRCVWLALG